jgi:hypothetical protein
MDSRAAFRSNVILEVLIDSTRPAKGLRGSGVPGFRGAAIAPGGTSTFD